MASASLHNLLEPAALIGHFLAHPPEGFDTFRLAGGTPAFATDFDLLTTLEPEVRRRLKTLPGFATWHRWLRPQTAFVGTTVSEYALLPTATDPDEFITALRRLASAEFPFVIVKDIPVDGELVGASAAGYARRLIEAARAAGFLIVEGQALAHMPIDFANVDAYLARLSSGRRRDIRRKLRSRAQLEIAEIPTGDPVFADEAVLAEYYALYLNVFAQSEIHFDRLSPGFFGAVLRDPHCGGQVITYRVHGRLIGYNLCFVCGDALVDKYIGFAYPAAREFNLYAVSWCHNIELALRLGLRRYIAGWTDPEIKRALGARFTLTRHAVFIRNPLVRSLLKPFKRWFEADQHWLERQHDASDT